MVYVCVGTSIPGPALPSASYRASRSGADARGDREGATHCDVFPIDRRTDSAATSCNKHTHMHALPSDINSYKGSFHLLRSHSVSIGYRSMSMGMGKSMEKIGEPGLSGNYITTRSGNTIPPTHTHTSKHECKSSLANQELRGIMRPLRCIL